MTNDGAPNGNSTVTPETPISYPTFTPSSSISITKLTRNNYPIWKAQILPYLKGQGVYGYIDGTIPSPSSTSLNYSSWIKKDNLLLSTINSSLSDEVLALVYKSTTSAAVWRDLETSFASQSRVKLVQLRSQLSSIRKGGQSSNDYFMSITRLADELAIAGQAITDDDLITYILSGLPSEYDSLVAIASSKTTLSLNDLYSMLLTTEARITHNNLPTPTTTVTIPPSPIPSANMAVRPPTPYHSRSPYPTTNMYSSRGRGRSTNRGRGSSFTPRPPRSSVLCQLCNKLGHTAHTCWWRYDQNSHNTSIRPSQTPMQAHNVTAPSRDWLPDTGATHHMTNAFNNLSLQAEHYKGPEQVHISDGQGLLGPGPP